jgi:predicted nuclease of predicted toxin-antitoxin system
VKFLVDAQLPARFARALTKAGHDAKHTTQLPDGNNSSDTDVMAFGVEIRATQIVAWTRKPPETNNT